jgi:hypothetical protein
MERAEEVKETLASPAPRKGAVTQLEAALAKAISSGAPLNTAGAGSPGTGARLKPFTHETLEMGQDILIKAVSGGEIDVLTSGKFETQMNKSIGKASFPFTKDFEAFMRKKMSA